MKAKIPGAKGSFSCMIVSLHYIMVMPMNAQSTTGKVQKDRCDMCWALLGVDVGVVEASALGIVCEATGVEVFSARWDIDDDVLVLIWSLCAEFPSASYD